LKNINGGLTHKNCWVLIGETAEFMMLLWFRVHRIYESGMNITMDGLDPHYPGFLDDFHQFNT